MTVVCSRGSDTAEVGHIIGQRAQRLLIEPGLSMIASRSQVRRLRRPKANTAGPHQGQATYRIEGETHGVEEVDTETGPNLR